MTLTDKQVILYMKNRNKGATQEDAAARSGISVRSARRLDEGQLQPIGHHHRRTRKDPLEQVWQTEVLPLLKQQPALTPITVLEHLQNSHRPILQFAPAYVATPHQNLEKSVWCREGGHVYPGTSARCAGLRRFHRA